MSHPEQINSPLLAARQLKRVFRSGDGLLRSGTSETVAVDGVSLDVLPGETLGVVGESGSGKSTLARLLMRLMDPTDGRVLLDGVDITPLHGSALKPFRRRMQMIFQDPYSSLNPRLSLRRILEEPLRTHGAESSSWTKRIHTVADQVGLPREYLSRHPHELSGGQRQRTGIARALILNPDLLIADEPVAALDVSIQAQVLNLLIDLQNELGLTYLFIAHDLSVVQYISNRIAVMQNGNIVETAPARTLYQNPQQDYTRKLINSIPRL